MSSGSRVPMRRSASTRCCSESVQATTVTGSTAKVRRERVHTEPLLPCERSQVLEHLIVRSGRSEDLRDAFVTKDERRTAADHRGEKDVSVGDEPHDAS